MAANKNFSSGAGVNPGFKERTAVAEKQTGQNIERPAFNPEKARTFERVKKSVSDNKVEAISADQFQPGGIVITSQVAQKMQERQIRIEGILSEGLEDIYAKMPPGNQREFKIAGEKTAREINALLSGAKVKLARIVNLIIKWLSLIPGANKYFLEKEAKIKTDKIIRMRDE